MYYGFMFLYSPRDNLHSVLVIGYNSIQRPVLVVFLSLYKYYYLHCSLLPRTLPPQRHALNLAPHPPWVFPGSTKHVPRREPSQLSFISIYGNLPITGGGGSLFVFIKYSSGTKCGRKDVTAGFLFFFGFSGVKYGRTGAKAASISF